MNALRTILAEIIGLFVDDGSLALALLLWCGGVGAATLIMPGLPGTLAAGGLLAGCTGILLLNVVHAARSRRSARPGA